MPISNEDAKLLDEFGADDAMSTFVDTDIANASRLIESHGDDLRWTPERGWMAWNGKVWLPDSLGISMQKAKLTALKIFDEIKDSGKDEQKELFQWARKSQSSERLRAMLSVAQCDVSCRLSAFDSDKWLLNCGNGLINLKSGELHTHNRDRMCSKITPVIFNPESSSQLWESFLARVMGNDTEMLDYLQRVVGYSLCGLTSEQVFFFLHGSGANGKSVFIETIQNLLGDYGQGTRTETIMSNGKGVPNDIAALAGARFVAANETGERQRFNESLIKDLTGGDTLTARFLRQEFFDFKPEFKLFIRGNHKPVISGTDNGIWRRIHLIPFTEQITEEEKDPNLLEKLRVELSGILAWAVKGCLKWRQHGLNPPEKVLDAVSEYRTEMDVLGEFITECCVCKDSVTTNATDLYKRYQQWCLDTGHSALNTTNFGGRMVTNGFDKKKSGTVRYIGVGILSKNVDGLDCLDSSPISPITRAQKAVMPKSGPNSPSCPDPISKDKAVLADAYRKAKYSEH